MNVTVFFETAIRAAKNLQNQGLKNKIRICLVGEGPEKSCLKEMAQKENITIVEFFDALPKKEIYQFLNKADVFIMLLKKSPIFRFGISPNKLFDYLSIGRPIIFGVDSPYNPIKKCNAGITIDPSDHESLANAIHTLFVLPKEE